MGGVRNLSVTAAEAEVETLPLPCGTPLHGIERSIDAVLVLHDGLDWGEEAQVIIDGALAANRTHRHSFRATR
jgi:hypothetical protein